MVTLGTRAQDLAISQAFLQFFYKIYENHANYISSDHKLNRQEFLNSRFKDVQKVKIFWRIFENFLRIFFIVFARF